MAAVGTAQPQVTQAVDVSVEKDGKGKPHIYITPEGGDKSKRTEVTTGAEFKGSLQRDVIKLARASTQAATKFETAQAKLRAATKELTGATPALTKELTDAKLALEKLKPKDKGIAAAQQRVDTAQTRLGEARGKLSAAQSSLSTAQSSLSTAQGRVSTARARITHFDDAIHAAQVVSKGSTQTYLDQANEKLDVDERSLGAPRYVSPQQQARINLNKADIVVVAAINNKSIAQQPVDAERKSISALTAQLKSEKNPTKRTEIQGKLTAARTKLAQADTKLLQADTKLAEAKRSQATAVTAAKLTAAEKAQRKASGL